MDVIMSIKPQYVDKILNGTKKFEFRKSIPKRIYEIDKAFIYSSFPIQRVVGYFTVKKVHKMNPLDLWLHTWKQAGIGINDFQQYFQNKEFGYAIEVDEVIIYQKPLLFKEIDPIGKVPQSFKYIQ